MNHYLSNLRDIEFNLFELLGRQDVLGAGPFSELDADTARSILAEVERLAVDDLAASLIDSDRNPPVYDAASRSVTLPESMKRSWKAYADAEWWRLDIPADLGGQPCPPSLRWAVQEMVLGANPAIHMYSSGFAFAALLWSLGTEDQRKLAQLIVAHAWGSTMVLTEPDAGSDVGAGRTKAVRQPDGTWHIDGVKRFITSGEHDLAGNIVHLVLARPEGHGPGTKGLSLFVVPKFLVDLETGELRERNGVYATNLEHKMGLKGSTTCELAFGAEHPAIGTLLGDHHDGIAQMFRLIESARMMVGTKAIATLSSGYLNALAYAKTRVQGADLAHLADKAAPRVTITAHPDVRRSLMFQKSYAEGMRALVLYTASIQDGVVVARAAGIDAEADERYNDLLLPIVKGYGSERSYELLGQSLQVYGGSGYLQDYPVEQYLRDAKIDTLYEGTTAIQGIDYFFRKIVRDRGSAMARLLAEVDAFVTAGGDDDPLTGERLLLGAAAADVQAIVAAMVAAYSAAAGDPRQIYRVGQNTTRLLLVSGDLVTGWLLLRQARIALDRLGDAGLARREQAFYEGKVAAARFFAANVLPAIGPQRAIAESVDLSLMDLAEDAF